MDLVEPVAFLTFERHRLSGVSLDATIARADLDGAVDRPASRFWDQSGFFGPPALEAKTRIRSPSRRYAAGFVCGRPVRAPVVLRRTSGAPSNIPPHPAFISAAHR